MWLGLPALGAALWWLKVPFAVPRRHWKELMQLTLLNMLVWHVIVILGVQQLSSGRSAILGYSMPVFAVLWGRSKVGPSPGCSGASWKLPMLSSSAG